MLQEKGSNYVIYIRNELNYRYGDCKQCGGLLTSVNDLSRYLVFLLKNINKKYAKNESKD